MIRTLIATIRQHQLIFSCALLIALFLLVLGHAPVIPVLAGCALAIIITVVRSSPGQSRKLRTSSVRGGPRV
jgi:uncharacterized membrane protein YesL